jgi:hypothetical protein
MSMESLFSKLAANPRRETIIDPGINQSILQRQAKNNNPKP